MSHRQEVLEVRNIFGWAELDEIPVELSSQAERMAEEMIVTFCTSACGASCVSDYRPLVCCSHPHHQFVTTKPPACVTLLKAALSLTSIPSVI